MKRSQQREIAIKAIYMIEQDKETGYDNFINYLKEEGIETKYIDYTLSIIDNFLDNEDTIIEYIDKIRGKYPLSRIATIDKSIINCALTEILYLGTPAQIAINEAVELSKIYSDDDAYKFVNSCLGTIYREHIND